MQAQRAEAEGGMASPPSANTRRFCEHNQLVLALQLARIGEYLEALPLLGCRSSPHMMIELSVHRLSAANISPALGAIRNKLG
jgi:hypothetical protein